MKLHALIKPLLIFFGCILLCVLLTFLIYGMVSSFAGYQLTTDTLPTGKLETITKIMGLSVSVVGFLAIVITVLYSGKSEQRVIEQDTIKKFQEFNSGPLRVARSKGWAIKKRWAEDPEYRKAIMDNNFDQNEVVHPEYTEDRYHIYQMLEFYLILSVYKGHKQALQELRYFYYGWSRKFLYEFSLEVESRRKVDSILTASHQTYMTNISYVESLRRLDKLCDLQDIPIHFDPHHDGG